MSKALLRHALGEASNWACRQCCKMSLRRRSLHGDARRANEARKTKPLRARRRDEAVGGAALIDAEWFEIEMAQGGRRRGEKKSKSDKTRSRKASNHATPSAGVGGCASYTPRRREKFRRGNGRRDRGPKVEINPRAAFAEAKIHPAAQDTMFTTKAKPLYLHERAQECVTVGSRSCFPLSHLDSSCAHTRCAVACTRSRVCKRWLLTQFSFLAP